MENQIQEQEIKKFQESLRKMQETLQEAIEEGRYWGLDQKIQSLQRMVRLRERI